MTIRPIICMPDPRLRVVSKPVSEVNDKVRALLDDMLETMYDAPGVGLAAIQIAQPSRLVVIDAAKKDDPPEPLCFINPEIIWSSDETNVHEEGCLSIPDYYEEVERPARVRVKFLDRDGVARQIEADGLLSTCIQHEIDHLNGVLFVDHLSRLKRERALKKFAKAAKRQASDDPAERTRNI